MLTGHQQDVPEPLIGERPRLAHHLVESERDAENRIVAREAAVGTIVDALVAEIKRREQPDDPSEAPPGDLARGVAEGF